MGLGFKWPWRRGAVPASMQADWKEQGYLALSGFYAGDELDAAEEEVWVAWNQRAPRIVVDDLVTGQRMRLADVDDDARCKHRFKTNDLYLEHPSVRNLALNARITPILAALLGSDPVLCNSLSFEQGSAQADHVDSLYMTPRTPDHLIAIWVALEDCHPDAGPLKYYPGSHRIPPYVFGNGGRHQVPAEMPQWRQYVEKEVQDRGLASETFAARRGDVFIWSANLLHGGSPIRDPARTRKSVVFHYYSHEDCVAQRCTLVPSHGAYWMHRRHQPVPGLGESDAPPLPPNAR